VELAQYSLGDFTTLKSVLMVQLTHLDLKDGILILPSETNLLAHTGLVVATDLLRDHAVRLEVATKVLKLG
jgi:hypothetical protein